MRLRPDELEEIRQAAEKSGQSQFGLVAKRYSQRGPFTEPPPHPLIRARPRELGPPEKQCDVES